MPKKPKKGGRPKSPEGTKTQVPLRAFDEQIAFWRKAAGPGRGRLAIWIRDTLTAEAERKLGEKYDGPLG